MTWTSALPPTSTSPVLVLQICATIPGSQFLTFMKSILMKRSTLWKVKYKMYSSENKRAPGRRMALNPMFKETNRLREWWPGGKIPTCWGYCLCFCIQTRDWVVAFIWTFNLKWTTVKKQRALKGCLPVIISVSPLTQFLTPRKWTP